MASRNFLKKFWYFIWEDDSIWSWLANIALAFLLIKFVIYPGLGWALGTSHPVVAVVSGSMEHDGSYDEWWDGQRGLYEAYNISKQEFRQYRFPNGFNKGDIMVLRGAKTDSLHLGDVLVFWTPSRSDPIIHRIIKASSLRGTPFFQTKGDHNLASNPDEKQIQESQIVGRAVLRIPYLGWVKIAFVKGLGAIIP